MKRFLSFIYFVGISVLLFFCILSIGKGFYLDGFLRHPLGTTIVGLLAIGTLLIIAFSDSVDITNNDEEEPVKVESTSLAVGNCKIDNKLIQKTLTDVIYQEDENIKVNYAFNGNVVDITVDIKRLDNIKVADVVKGMENELKIQLSEMFNINNELDIRFTIVEVDVPVEEEIKDDSETETEQTQTQEKLSDSDNETKAKEE